MNVIGTCSECGGPVSLPMMHLRPEPSCERCGAVAQNGYGPVIPMRRRERVPSTDDPSPYDLGAHGGLGRLKRR